jgi:hypothetical protein
MNYIRTHLSQALTRYYSKNGTRIIFKNAQSLNQLAASMWETLGYREVDASVLSRVLKGERLFTLPQLEVFCALNGIPQREKEQLQACLQEDVNSRSGPGWLAISPDFAGRLTEDVAENTFILVYFIKETMEH